MNASWQNGNVYQALTQVYTLLSQDISHPQIEGRTLAQQIKDKHDAIKQAIHKIDKEHDPKQTNWIKKKQQKKISKQPTQANQILGGEIEQSGNQALMDPASNMVQTEPSKIFSIVENSFTKSYLPTDSDAARNYPWTSSQCYDWYKLETPVTRVEDKHQYRRTWLHSSILDSCNFQECLKLLTNNKAPGPDGIVNELLKALPLEYQQTMHKLLIIMWATGITPTNWKSSETILIYEEKGPETDVASYRPIGLANTLYKLWTRLIRVRVRVTQLYPPARAVEL